MKRKVWKVRADVGGKPKPLQPAPPHADVQGDGGKIMRARVRAEILMAPSLYAGDIAVIDLEGEPEQGAIVAVEASQVEAGDTFDRTAAAKFTTFRRRFVFGGVEIFLAEESRAAGRVLRFGKCWPVVAVECDELSPNARTPRPMELAARAAAAERALQLVTGRWDVTFPTPERRLQAVEEAARMLGALQDELKIRMDQWESPAAGESRSAGKGGVV